MCFAVPGLCAHRQVVRRLQVFCQAVQSCSIQNQHHTAIAQDAGAANTGQCRQAWVDVFGEEFLATHELLHRDAQCALPVAEHHHIAVRLLFGRRVAQHFFQSHDGQKVAPQQDRGAAFDGLVLFTGAPS